MNRQVYIKAEQIARMVVKGWPLTRIAIEMGMSYDGLYRITKQPEYLKIEEEVRLDVTGMMDARLAKRAAMEKDMDDAVPEAFQVLLDGVRKKRDLKAALEVLDRDPRRQFAKASRNAPTEPDKPLLASEALASAVKDADVTHTILESAKQPGKAEA